MRLVSTILALMAVTMVADLIRAAATAESAGDPIPEPLWSMVRGLWITCAIVLKIVVAVAARKARGRRREIVRRA